MVLKFKKLEKDIIGIKSPAIEGDAGYDLYCASDCLVKAKSSASISTKIAIELPEGYWFEIMPKSGLATKYNLADGLYSIDRIRDNFAITAKGFTPYWPTIGPGTPSGAQGDPSANGQLQGGYLSPLPGGYYAVEPYRVGVAIPVGFTATSLDENIHFYLEPALSFTMIGGKAFLSICIFLSTASFKV